MKLALALLLSTICFPVMAATGFSIESLISAIIYIVIIGLIFWVLWWFLGYVGIPEPFNKVIRVILGLVALLIVIYFLMSFLGPMPRLR